MKESQTSRKKSGVKVSSVMDGRPMRHTGALYTTHPLPRLTTPHGLIARCDSTDADYRDFCDSLAA